MPPTTERLLWSDHKSQDFLGEATTTSRLTLGLLNLPPVLLWTPWYDGCSILRPSHPTVHRSVCWSIGLFLRLPSQGPHGDHGV